ncbi:MAG: cydB [Chlamydiales bacterium]|jgi:cytochrome d ubiquinol oxidase subunit II|nr:cydB [Chlamydiales bacterium]
MTHIDLQTLWYGVIVFFITMYLIMDGFDLGVGALHLFSRTDHERRSLLNAIGPFWDGNEVWLITLGACFFGAYPVAYSTIFSAFYLPLLLFILALILRASSIEFRSKVVNPTWRSIWDGVFSISSSIIPIGLGLVIGCLLMGFPLNENLEYVGERLTLFLKPYGVVTGITLWSVLAMHGAIFLLIKTEGELQIQVKKWFKNAHVLAMVMIAIFAMYTLRALPHLKTQMRLHPSVTGAYLLSIVVLFIAISYLVYNKKYVSAFVASSLMIASCAAYFAYLAFPMLVYNPENIEQSITIYNSSSSFIALKAMLLVAVIAIPAVIAYTAYVHRVFQGKVKVDSSGY